MNRATLPAALILVLSGGLALTAQQPAANPAPDAQQAPAPVHRHHAPNSQKEIAHLTKALNLTPDQAAKVEPILADRDQKVAALQSDTTLTEDARRQQMKAIHKASEQQLDAVLTPDQREQMKSLHHEHEGGKGGEQTQPLTTPPSA